jgi:hypothetical protein
MRLTKCSLEFRGRINLQELNELAKVYAEDDAKLTPDQAMIEAVTERLDALRAERAQVIDLVKQRAVAEGVYKEPKAPVEAKVEPKVDETAKAPEAAKEVLPPKAQDESTAKVKEPDTKVDDAPPADAPVKGYAQDQAEKLASSMSKKGLPSEAYPHPSGDGTFAIRAPEPTAPKQAPEPAANTATPADANTVKKGVPLESITVKVEAVVAETGTKVKLSQKADVALADVDNRLTLARRLLECLAS